MKHIWGPSNRNSGRGQIIRQLRIVGVRQIQDLNSLVVGASLRTATRELFTTLPRGKHAAAVTVQVRSLGGYKRTRAWSRWAARKAFVPPVPPPRLGQVDLMRPKFSFYEPCGLFKRNYRTIPERKVYKVYSSVSKLKPFNPCEGFIM